MQTVIFAAILALGALAVLWLIAAPIRLIWKLLLNGFLGLLCLLFVDLLCTFTGVWLHINPVSVLTVGILGLPGLALLLALELLF